MTFFDSTFLATDYQQAFKYNALSSTSQYAAVPNTGLQFTMATLGPVDSPAVLDGVLNTTFVYNPMTQGAITSISASSAKTFSATSLSPAGTTFTYGNNFRPLIEQDGKFYTTGIGGPNLGPVTGGNSATLGPLTLSKAGLTADNFFLINTTTGTIMTGTTGLDFGGDALTFGVVQLLNSVGNDTPNSAKTNYADLSFNIISTSPPAVPLPAAAPLFGGALLAFGVVGYGVNRRRSASAA